MCNCAHRGPRSAIPDGRRYLPLVVMSDPAAWPRLASRHRLTRPATNALRSPLPAVGCFFPLGQASRRSLRFPASFLCVICAVKARGALPQPTQSRSSSTRSRASLNDQGAFE
jgi:hypothetical protein